MTKKEELNELNQLREMIRTKKNNPEFEIENGILVKYHGESSEVVVPEGVTAIGGWAFSCCGIEKVHLPDSLIEIGANAFFGCFSLAYIKIPESVRKIGANCFCNCNINNLNHSQIKIENGCVIKDNCLQYISVPGDGEIIIPDYVTSIGDAAFINSHVESITIPSSVKSIGDNAFLGIEDLESITILEGVQEINMYAFYQCHNLKTVILPSTLKKIGKSAFAEDINLENLVLPEGLEIIGKSAFADCTKLKGLKIPEGIKSIGEYALDF